MSPLTEPTKLTLAKSFTQQAYMWEFPQQHGLWYPGLISTALWLDAADLATVTADGSSLVSNVNDKSGNGRNFTASSGARPTYSANTLNGRAVFTFGGLQHLTSANAASTWTFLHDSTKSALFLVTRPGNSSNPDSIGHFCGTNASSSGNVGLQFFFDDRAVVPRDNGLGVVTSNGGGTSSSFTYQDNSITPNVFSLVSCINDPAATTAVGKNKIQVNAGSEIANNSITNAPTSAAPSFTLQVGAAGNNQSPLTGAIAEIVFVSGTISALNKQKLEGYLAHKWGLTANLPAGHPYKTVGPTP